MRVYIDRKPLEDGNSTRGVGYYTRYLIQSLARYYPDIHIAGESKDADIIHYPYFDLFFPTLKVKRNKPTIVTVHDVIPLLFPDQFKSGLKGKFHLWQQKVQLRKAARLVTISEQSKKDIAQYLNVPKEHITNAFLATDEQYKLVADGQKVRVQHKYHLPDQFFLYVGDVNHNKNLHRLINAFAALTDSPVHLVLIGKAFLEKGLYEADEIATQISEMELGARVHRLGFVPEEDIVAIYNCATAYVQVSLYEGFGIPVLNAFATGVPVICANNSSLPEVAGEAAYYINPYDIGDIRFGMEQMQRNHDLQEQLRAQGFERVKLFSQQKFAEKMVAVYSSVYEMHGKH